MRRGLPVFERLFLGGEYSVRGFDIRSIGPTVPGSFVVLGGNKSLLFNAEYMISIMSQVRIVTFFDAGQVRDFGEPFAWMETLTRSTRRRPAAADRSVRDVVAGRSECARAWTTEMIGKTSAFKTSTGVELRFFMPVLNVPFRLIYAWNPQRGGVLDNNLQPAKETSSGSRWGRRSRTVHGPRSSVLGPAVDEFGTDRRLRTETEDR